MFEYLGPMKSDYTSVKKFGFMKFFCAAQKEEFVPSFFRNVNKLCSIYVPLNLRNSNNFSIYSAQHSIRAMIQFLLFFPFQTL